PSLDTCAARGSLGSRTSLPGWEFARCRQVGRGNCRVSRCPRAASRAGSLWSWICARIRVGEGPCVPTPVEGGPGTLVECAPATNAPPLAIAVGLSSPRGVGPETRRPARLAMGHGGSDQRGRGADERNRGDRSGSQGPTGFNTLKERRSRGERTTPASAWPKRWKLATEGRLRPPSRRDA